MKNYKSHRWGYRSFVSQKTGFSLIEMIVSVAIFSVVAVVAAGAILSIINANQKSQSLKTVINNLNFAVESMARNMRVGSDYHCGSGGILTIPQDCPSVASSLIAFKSVDGNTVVYRKNGTRIERSINGGVQYTSITAPEIEIAKMDFYVDGTAQNDNEQPKILLVIAGKVLKRDKTESLFNLQTLISQRLPDR